MTIEEIAKENQVSLEELKKIEDEIRQKYAPVAGFLSKGEIDSYVIKTIKQHIEKCKNLNLTHYFGVVLTISPPKDGMIKRRSEAIKKYIEDPEVAIGSGIVQEYKDGMKRFLAKGIVTSKPIEPKEIPKNAVYLPDQKVHIVLLDSRESWANGKKNFGYLKSLPLEQYFCNIEGLCSEDGTNWQAFRMTLNDCQEHINRPNVMIPQSKLIKFMAKIKSKDPLILNYVNKYTKFELVPGDISAIHEHIMSFYNITPISDVKQTFDARKTGYDVTSVFGQVASKWVKEPTDDKPYPTTTINIFDNTGEGTFKILLHSDVNAEFTEGDIVKVWGSLAESNKWDADLHQPSAEKEMMMFANGIYSFATNELTEEQKSEDWGDEV